MQLRSLTWAALGALLCLSAASAAESKLSGSVSIEWRYFNHAPSNLAQFDGSSLSFSAQPEFYRSWNDGKSSITFTPFIRRDQHDRERSHTDIRELNWLHAGDGWEIQVGISKVFWGVTESQHLVDIVNQTDAIEAPDGEDKLGQPMIRLSLERDWGTTTLFVLPYFRERTFAGNKGRLRTTPRVDASQTVYESGRKQKHVDFAIRWSHSIGDWDVGLSHFAGTSRDPRFKNGVDGNGQPVLIPVYDQIRQTGLDLQATKGGWLWKLELIHRSGQLKPYTASTAGFEYTFNGIRGSRMDLGVLMEYLYDTRSTAPFQNDLMFGARLAFNDTQSTEILMGVIIDRKDTNQRGLFVEASRRLGDSWKLNLEARLFSNVPGTHALFGVRNDDYIQLELARYF